MSIDKIHKFPFCNIHFSGKIKLILYPRVRNSITQLTIIDICCIAFCRLTFREFLTDTQWKKVTPRNLHEMQRRNKQWNMKMGQIIDEVDFFLRFKYSGKATKIWKKYPVSFDVKVHILISEKATKFCEIFPLLLSYVLWKALKLTTINYLK